MNTMLQKAPFEIVAGGPAVSVVREGDSFRLELPAHQTATLLERYNSVDDQATRNNRLLVKLQEGARLTHYKIVQEGAATFHDSFAEVSVASAAAYDSHVFLLEGASLRNSIHVRLDGEGASCSLNGLYIAGGDQKMETHTVIEHRRPHGTSREMYKGILDGHALGVFDGLVIVQKEAQKTDSAQTNRNLLLSTTAKANSNPELKIFANDVKCKHGATIGQLDPTALFYLRSRGIAAPEAQRLLMHAFASEMIDRLEDVRLREELAQTVLNRLSTLHV